MAKIKPNISALADRVSIRMYCMGTGDCFVIKFLSGEAVKYTMMIDCGSCQVNAGDFKQYIDNLDEYVHHHIDLLVVTHEHNDHVNGFAKCADIFAHKNFTISNAWFAWTENPADPNGHAKRLIEEREKAKQALNNVINHLKETENERKSNFEDSSHSSRLIDNDFAFSNGLNTLAQINLSEDASEKKSLPGMTKIKKILTDKGTKIEYLEPGQTITIDQIPEFKFHILGPPFDRDSVIFSKEKQGKDVFKNNSKLEAFSLSTKAYLDLADTVTNGKDLPFDQEHVMVNSPNTKYNLDPLYNDTQAKWRKIDYDWLSTAGAMAIRLNSHINNTSLAIALESTETNKVIMLPGDAEFGSWMSWHKIAKWQKTDAQKVGFVEDLLNRTVFYKVGHHLSYNGTALEQGIAMMTSDELAAMATLDRQRISVKWKTTMPNHQLMAELIRKCKGKLFIMDEFEIKDGPSKTLDPLSLGKDIYEEGPKDGKLLYKQYTVTI